MASGNGSMGCGGAESRVIFSGMGVAVGGTNTPGMMALISKTRVANVGVCVGVDVAVKVAVGVAVNVVVGVSVTVGVADGVSVSVAVSEGKTIRVGSTCAASPSPRIITKPTIHGRSAKICKLNNTIRLNMASVPS